jgi:hypothetical protein
LETARVKQKQESVNTSWKKTKMAV